MGKETEPFHVQHSVENGIERVVYTPVERRFETPILMQHGMWHGAWCWQQWQELFAGWGWESYAFSLPGHAGSPTQRPVYFCTLTYYLKFLKAEVARLPRKPVLMGHSMGGEIDAVIAVEHERQSAAHYGADFRVIPGAAHNIMVEYNYRETAESIHNWLIKRGVT
jgi:pimeloyl-ACP methyl ester carboxylesterase